MIISDRSGKGRPPPGGKSPIMSADNRTQPDEETTAPGNQPQDGAAPQEDAPVQYYSRSELSQRQLALHRFSPQRKSTLIAISLIMTMALIVAGAASTTRDLNRLGHLAELGPQGSWSQAQGIIGGARAKTLGLAAGAVATMTVAVLIMARAGPRIVALEHWIRRMGAGDLNHSVRPQGNDEITEIAYDLEVLRRQSVRAQQLDLVQQLSQDLQGKNEELEQVLQELHTTQDQVISRQKLAELGELTAGVAHEIRNPLNLVQNFAEASNAMMEELRETMAGLDGPPDEEQADLIRELTAELSDSMQRILQNAARANRIVQNMLAMGRTTRGNHQMTNINELVENHAMLAYHSARSHDPEFNIEIVREFDPDAGEANIVSEDIGRVILNLVGNACYATAERGRSEPEHQPTMWLTTLRDGDDVEIRVRDNGNGIPEDIMGKIFNPFFTTKPTDQGTGLGLSLSNDIVREHGGTIRPESRAGEYAQFTVRIPADAGPARQRT